MVDVGRSMFNVPRALTRTKDELYLTYPMTNPKSYSGDIICRPSRFLEDFPFELVEKWTSETAPLGRMTSRFETVGRAP